MDRVFEIELSDELFHVCGIGVHLVAAVGLARAAVAPSIMGDYPVAFVKEEHQLGVPIIGAERPAVMEDDRLGVLGSPILVENVVRRRSW